MLIEFSFLVIFTILIPQKCYCVTKFQNNACNSLNLYPFKDVNRNCYYDPDVESTTPNIITRHGYPVETHTVQTDDGYILTIFRIPAKEANSSTSIFMQHGGFTSSSIWLILGSKSLPFKLADLGYDVWLGNARGTIYSQEHVSLSRKDKEYWNYNLDTMAANDVAKELRYVTEKVGAQVIYIGHSIGTTLLFMLGSDQPDLVQQFVKGYIAIAPIAYVTSTFPSNIPSKVAPQLKIILNLIGVHGLQSTQESRNKFIPVCIALPQFCFGLMEYQNGKFSGQFPNELLLNYYYKNPDASAVDCIYQSAQTQKSQEFKHFDYGAKKNKKIYNSDSPPFYDLSKFVIPSIFFYGENDVIVAPNEVARTFNELGSTMKRMVRIPLNSNDPPYSHLMFLFSKDIQHNFYPALFQAIEELNV